MQLFTREANLPLPHWIAVVFPTRPISVASITQAAPSLLLRTRNLASVIRGLRGNWVEEPLLLAPLPGLGGDESSDGFFVGNTGGRVNELPHIALTSFEVTDQQWEAARDGNPDHSLDRYQRLHDILNRASKANPKPDYVLLPELALPRRWMHSLARKLSGRGISLIAGVEYERVHGKNGELRNDAIVSLRSNFLGYRSNLVLLQPKLAPAWKEQSQLATKNLRLAPGSDAVIRHPVFIHNDFAFGVLICSELTDMENRLRFQGKVDALMIPEWNMDLDTFSVLVETAALDVHAFIAQANNRTFGDTRLRGPMKKRYARDVIRVKGGTNDYFVIAPIEFRKLRRYQSNPVPPDGEDDEFKPFPQGFPSRISQFRKFLF